MSHFLPKSCSNMLEAQKVALTSKSCQKFAEHSLYRPNLQDMTHTVSASIYRAVSCKNLQQLPPGNYHADM